MTLGDPNLTLVNDNSEFEDGSISTGEQDVMD
jgi:hypothetical protein